MRRTGARSPCQKIRRGVFFGFLWIVGLVGCCGRIEANAGDEGIPFLYRFLLRDVLFIPLGIVSGGNCLAAQRLCFGSSLDEFLARVLAVRQATRARILLLLDDATRDEVLGFCFL